MVVLEIEKNDQNCSLLPKSIGDNTITIDEQINNVVDIHNNSYVSTLEL